MFSPSFPPFEPFDWADDVIEEAESLPYQTLHTKNQPLNTLKSFNWADDAIEEAESMALTKLESFDWADDAIEEAESLASNKLESFDWADDAIEEAESLALTTSDSFDWADDVIEEAESLLFTDVCAMKEASHTSESFDWAEDAIDEVESRSYINLRANEGPSNTLELFDWADDAIEEAESLSFINSRVKNETSNASEPFDWADDAIEEAGTSLTTACAENEASNISEPSSPVSSNGSSTATSGRTSPDDSDEDSFYETSLDDLVESAEGQKELETDGECFRDTTKEQDWIDTDDEQSQIAMLNSTAHMDPFFKNNWNALRPSAMRLEEEDLPSMAKPKLPYDGEIYLNRMKTGRVLGSKDISGRRITFAEKLRLLKLGIEVSYAHVGESEFALTKDKQLRGYRAKPSCLRRCWNFES